MSTVSVLLPVRNGMPELEAAVGSIRAQTLDDWELIAVDDGSTDGTGPYLDHMAQADPRIRPFHQPPGGIVAALNAGLVEARAQFIARMDADDLSHPDRLASQAGYLEMHPETGIVSCLVHFGGNADASAGYAAHVDWLNGLTDHESMALNRFVDAPVAHPSVMFRRQLIDDHGPYTDTEVPEDHDLWLRWFEQGVRFGKVPDSLLTWNDPPSRLSRCDPRYAPEAFYRLKCDCLLRHLTPERLRGRSIWLWGAGRITRKRFRPLGESLGGFAGLIDPDPAKVGSTLDGALVRSAEDLPSPTKAFIVSGVGNRDARDRIRSHLRNHGWIEGQDYLCAA